MKRKIYHSFRFEIIIYVLLSMFFTVITEGCIVGVGYLIYNSLNPSNAFGYNVNNVSPDMDMVGNRMLQNNITDYTGISNDTNVSQLNEYEQFNSMKGNTGTALIVFIIIILIILALGLFITYFLLLTRRFNNYLNEIAYGIQQFSAGYFDTRIEVKNNNELTDIAHNLNNMVEDIQTLIDNERKVESKKNDLITNVAHDLRTPLTSIIGYLDLVSSKELTEEIRAKYISIAYSKSKRLEHLIDDLFTYTKLDFGEIKLSITEVDLIKMMEQMTEEFYPRFQESNLEYTFLTNEKSLMLMADGALLGRTFANLFENAIKYGADGKNIIIKVEKEEYFAITSITNFGEIIPKEDLDNIFNKFYRVDNSRNLTTGGTGLGLTIAKNIVKMHKGEIRAKSNLNGTVFEVKLPINEQLSALSVLKHTDGS